MAEPPTQFEIAAAQRRNMNPLLHRFWRDSVHYAIAKIGFNKLGTNITMGKTNLKVKETFVKGSFFSFLNGAISAINISVLQTVEVGLIMGLLTLRLIYWKTRQMSNSEQYVSHNLTATRRTLQ